MTSCYGSFLNFGPSGNSNVTIEVTANFQGFTVSRGGTQDDGGGMRVNESSTTNIDLMIFDENVDHMNYEYEYGINET